jgi:acyl dehydratase
MSLFMRLYADGVLHDAVSLGSGGGDEFRWLAPVYAGDVLTGRLTVVDLRPSERRPERGGVQLRGEMLRDGEVVLRARFVGLFGRRPAP